MIVNYKLLEKIRKELEQEMAEFLTHWPNSEMLMSHDVQNFEHACLTVNEALKDNLEELPGRKEVVDPMYWWMVKSLTYELLKRDYMRMKENPHNN